MSVAAVPLTVFAASQIGTPGPANMALVSTGARIAFRRAQPFKAGAAEPNLMYNLAGLTAAFVLFVLFGGGT